MFHIFDTPDGPVVVMPARFFDLVAGMRRYQTEQAVTNLDILEMVREVDTFGQNGVEIDTMLSDYYALVSQHRQVDENDG